MRIQFFVRLLPLLALCMLAESLLATWSFYRQANAELEERIALLGTDPKNVFALSAAIKWTRLEQMEHVVTTLLLIPEITEMRVVDTDGDAIYEDGDSEPFANVRVLDFPLAYNENYYLDEDELEALEEAFQTEPEPMGRLQITYQLDTLMSAVARYRTTNLALSALFLALIVITVELAFRTSILDPVNRLRQAIRETRQTGIKKRLAWERGDEMGALAAEYDRLMDTQEVTERQLSSARESAEAASVAKGVFLANMSHEIRTPMNGVVGMVDLLRQGDLTREQREFVDIVHNSTVALLEIIDDVLDLSKIEAGELRLDETAFDIEKTVMDLVALLTGKAREKGLALHVRFCGDPIPTLIGDPSRLRQILLNYAGNALKFTERGHILFTIRHTRLSDGRSDLRMSVSDTGIGIPSEKQATIFDPFIQAESGTTRRFGGTGLGLSICRRLAELMGGRVGVYAAPEEGSTFWVALTLDPAATHLPRDISPPPIDGRAVLVVDPDPIGRAITAEKLHGWGAEVTEVANLTEARTVLGVREVDLVLLEKMPDDTTGRELIAELRELGRHRDTPMAVYTARPMLGEDARFREIGLSGYLSRPADRSMLARFLTRILTRSEDFITRGSLAEEDSRRQDEPATIEARVMLVDDNRVNRKVVSRMLEKLGCEVVVAEDGRQAIETWERVACDLILMDCHMPEIDGLQATRMIREREFGGESMPIVALTAGVMPEERERCFEVGMNDFLSKPVSMQALRQVLQRHLRSGQVESIGC